MGIQHNPQLISESYLGPYISRDIQRGKPQEYSTGIVPSYVPDQCLYSHTSKDIHNKYIKRCIEEIIYKPIVDYSFIKSIRQHIANHFEMRIQLLFQQMLFVYKTGLEFEFCNVALDQVGSPECKQSIVESTEERYACAHSSTLPTLRLLNEDDKSNSSIVLGNKTFFFYSWNITTFLPEKVNLIDSNLDKAKCEKNLTVRGYATNLLNAVSKSEVTPRRGLENFLISVINVIESMNETDDMKAFVVKTYLKVAKSYSDKVSDYSFIKRLCYKYNTEKSLSKVYMSVQTKMHNLFCQEMEQQRIEREAVMAQALPPLAMAKLNSLKRQMTVLVQSEKVSNTKTIKQYVKFCGEDDLIKYCFLEYLHQITKDELKDDMKAVLKIKSIKTAVNIEMTDEIWELYNFVLKTLKTQFNKKEIRNIGSIIFPAIKNYLEEN